MFESFEALRSRTFSDGSTTYETLYGYASEQLAHGRLNEAYCLFCLLAEADYGDSAAKAEQCRYEYAQQLLRQGKEETAQDMLDMLGK